MKDEIQIIFICLAIALIVGVFVIAGKVEDLKDKISDFDDLVAKHSVHPQHGNYVKIDRQTGRPCHPWDDCR